MCFTAALCTLPIPSESDDWIRAQSLLVLCGDTHPFFMESPFNRQSTSQEYGCPNWESVPSPTIMLSTRYHPILFESDKNFSPLICGHRPLCSVPFHLFEPNAITGHIGSIDCHCINDCALFTHSLQAHFYLSALFPD